MIIGQHILGSRPLIVAEIGNNHEGSFETAAKLVEAAAECGVDAVKFQTFRTEYYVSTADEERFKRLKSFELTQSQFLQLCQLTHKLGLLFISTPFDLDSAKFLAPLVDALKIASGDNDFYPLLDLVAATDKPLIISTGVSDLTQVERTVARIRGGRPPEKLNLALLHCVSSYPAPPSDINLRAIPFLRRRMNVPIGYSDHSLGITACVGAAALGAVILEKHFTLDHHFSSFRDHQLSATPAQMSKLVQEVHNLWPMLGHEEKVVQKSETDNCTAVRRSIVAVRDLAINHKLTLEDITWVRPGGGLAPGQEVLLLDRRLKRPIKAGERLTPHDVE